MKAIADIKINLVMIISVVVRVENMVAKIENAGYFLLFQPCF